MYLLADILALFPIYRGQIITDGRVCVHLTRLLEMNLKNTKMSLYRVLHKIF